VKYTVIYEKGATSWGAYVPDLPGVIAVGDSREEAEHLIHEASNSTSTECAMKDSRSRSRQVLPERLRLAPSPNLSVRILGGRGVSQRAPLLSRLHVSSSHTVLHLQEATMRFSVGCLIAAIAAAQQPSQEQILHFAHTPDTRNAQEIATVIRTIPEIRDVKLSDDNPPSTLTVAGTPEQIAAAGWLFAELDQSAPSQQMREYKLSGTRENVVRIYHVTNARSVQEFQEVATAARNVGEIRRVITYNAPKQVVMRGTADQAAFLDWLLPLMDKPLSRPVQHSASPQFVMPDPRDEGVTQVFYAGNAATVADFQDLAITLRAMSQEGRSPRVFTYNAGREIVVRGTASQLAMAEWLFDELDQPPTARSQDTSRREYQVPGRDDVMRVFYLAHVDGGQNVQSIIPQIRTATAIQRAFSYGSRMGLVLRGTAAQIAAAEHLVQELDKP
jgi:type II secretory pathway component GspD/PulD (secretin)